MSEFHMGDNNAVRFAIMPKDSDARPSTGTPDAPNYWYLPNVTTSDVPMAANSVTRSYYKTNGGKATRSGTPNVTFTVSGDLPLLKAGREPVYRLRAAILAGERIWMERALDDDAPEAEWEGGLASLSNVNLPSPSDNATNYSVTCGLSGDVKGPHDALAGKAKPDPVVP